MIGEKICIQLSGCIINFFMDDKMIDFLQAAHNKRGVLSGCFKRYLDGTINDENQSEQMTLKRKGKNENSMNEWTAV